MALAHYRLLQTSREDRPKLLFDLKLDIQDIRSGYDGSWRVVFLGDWLENPNLQWTHDMVREISLDELQRIDPLGAVAWPESAEDLMGNYVSKLPGPQIWRSRELGIYSKPRESFEDFLMRCREGLIVERSKRMRNLSELFFHRFLRLEKKLHELLANEEGLKSNQILNLEADLKRLFSAGRESLSQMFLEDYFQLVEVKGLAWDFPRRPEFQEHLHALASDLVRAYNVISVDCEERAKDIESYDVPMGSVQIETLDRGVVWT